MSNAPIVLLLSGVNLNLLGDREPEIYGTATLADHVATATTTASAHGLTIEHLQSNAESDGRFTTHLQHSMAQSLNCICRTRQRARNGARPLWLPRWQPEPSLASAATVTASPSMPWQHC